MKEINAARHKMTAFLIDMLELAFVPTMRFLLFFCFFFNFTIKLLITEANAFTH